MNTNAIVIDQLAKRYGQTQAVQGVSFAVAAGELFGLIGPDGAGKTTLFKMLVTLLRPDAGQATVLGRDVVASYRWLRQTIGYMPGRFSLYPDLTVGENLRFFATIFGTTIEANYGLIQAIYEQLKPFSARRAGALSGGMKQKLALCCALIHKPDVLFLDEPTTGVDAVSRKEFWDMLKSLQQQGLTMLVSTPYMDEAGLCDRVAFMHTGRMLAVDTPHGITSRFTKPLFAVQATNTYELIQALRQAPFTATCYAFGDSVHLTAQPNTSLASINAFMQQKNIPATSIRPIEAGVEDTFMALMG